MAVLKIVKYPADVLEAAAEDVTEFNDELRTLIADMFETMYHAPGVGLAAPQVGVSRRVFVMDCSGGKDPAQKITMINPRVLVAEGEQLGRGRLPVIPRHLLRRQTRGACRSSKPKTPTATRSNSTARN
jgi:peptide deformylase